MRNKPIIVRFWVHLLLELSIAEKQLFINFIAKSTIIMIISMFTDTTLLVFTF